MIGLLAVLLCGLLLPLPARAAEDYASFGFHQHSGAQVPMELELRDEAGQPVRLGNIMAGRPVILVLGYFHCPNLCGIVRGNLLQALGQSGLQADQYNLIVLGIDPTETSRDAAAAKREDLARFPVPGGDTAWHYLTAPQAATKAVAQIVGFPYRYDRQLKQYLHPTGLIFLSPTGRVSGYLLGIGYSPGDLALDVTQAGADRIGQAASAILLLCCDFDPTTGRYTLAITKVLQLGCLLTVLTLGTTIVLALRGERPR